MSVKSRQVLAIVAACALVVGVMAAAGITVWRDLAPEERDIIEPILNPRLGLILMITLVGAGAAAVLMKSFVQANLLGPSLLADELGLIVGTDPSRRLKPSGSPELQRIAESVNALADQRRSVGVVSIRPSMPLSTKACNAAGSWTMPALIQLGIPAGTLCTASGCKLPSRNMESTSTCTSE